MGSHASNPHNSGICAVQVTTRSAPRTLHIRGVFANHTIAASAADCASAACQIVLALRQQLPYQWLVEGGALFDFELASIVDGFESLNPDVYPSEPTDQAMDDLNEHLARLLDWADDIGIKLTS